MDGRFWVLIFALAFPLSGFATSDFYKCFNRVSGEWNYGRAPYACNANAFGEDKFVFNTYSKVIFDDRSERSPERQRYVQQLHAILADAAEYYMKKRKPQVSSEELNWWVLAVVTTAAHESYMSHYRLAATDTKLKMMRGDSGHGHGLMQVDDRAHFNAVDKGIAWNLISNVTYGMDILFQGWERAPSQSCVKSATNYQARTRAAWSAYNGGPAKICRWTNSFDRWSQNDKNFYASLSNQTWKTYVAKRLPSSVDVACLIEKKENCPLPGDPLPPQEVFRPQTRTLYQSSQFGYCQYTNNKMLCVRDYRDAICLSVSESVTSSSPTVVSDKLFVTSQPQAVDRHTVCPQFSSNLYKVGTQVELLKNINLRSTPGGGLVTTIPTGTRLQISDFEIRDVKLKDRYYQVKYQNQTGYIYAGSELTQDTWIKMAAPTVPASLARVGQFVEIVMSGGINLRRTPGGEKVTTLAQATRVSVSEVKIVGTNNEVYYRVSNKSVAGYIYSGLLKPQSTVEQWTKVVR